MQSIIKSGNRAKAFGVDVSPHFRRRYLYQIDVVILSKGTHYFMKEGNANAVNSSQMSHVGVPTRPDDFHSGLVIFLEDTANLFPAKQNSHKSREGTKSVLTTVDAAINSASGVDHDMASCFFDAPKSGKWELGPSIQRSPRGRFKRLNTSSKVRITVGDAI